MKVRLFFTIFVLLLITSCTTDDSQDITEAEVSTILTLEMEAGYLTAEDSFYYLIQDNTGNNIQSGFGDLTNGQSVSIEGDGSISGLNISLFEYNNNQNRIEATTYLNVDTDKTITLKTSPSAAISAPVQVQFSNVPNQLDEFVFSSNNRFTPGSRSILPPGDISFGIGGYAQNQTSFITIEDINSSIPKYQILTLTDANVNQIDLANSVAMETSHQISSSILDAQISTRLVGYQNADFENPEGNHVLYTRYSPSLEQGAFTIYSLDNFFSDYKLTVYAEDDNAEYIQITNGNIPSDFTALDANFSINQNSFSSYQISGDNTVSASQTYWTLKGENGVSDILRWNVYASDDQSAFITTTELPSTLPDELAALGDLEQLNLEFTRALNVPTADYNETMNLIFNGERLSLLPLLYYKTIYTQ